MSASSDKLRIRWPEFADTTDWPDATLDVFIADAAAELAPAVWDSYYTPGVIALAAHFAALAKRSANAGSAGAAVGGLTAIKTGDDQISFGAVGAATASADEASLRTTPYGLEYLRLSKRVAVSPSVFF